MLVWTQHRRLMGRGAIGGVQGLWHRLIDDGVLQLRATVTTLKTPPLPPLPPFTGSGEKTVTGRMKKLHLLLSQPKRRTIGFSRLEPVSFFVWGTASLFPLGPLLPVGVRQLAGELRQASRFVL